MEPFAAILNNHKPKLFDLKGWTTSFPGLHVGFSSRFGGVSLGDFQSLNCGLHVSDDDDKVVFNRALIAEAIGIPFHAWTYAEQVHGNEVVVVTSADKGKGITSRKSAIQGKDAFITQQTGICMAALFADCVPLYFYDPVHRAVGLAHAGWKGTVQQIAVKTVEAMIAAFNSDPSELVAAIGPSIGPCCYEVDQFVINRVTEIADDLRSEQTITDSIPVYMPIAHGKYMLNLQEINRQLLLKAGILPLNIEISQLCTSCRYDLFFSHRKEKGKTGRMIAWIGMTDELLK